MRVIGDANNRVVIEGLRKLSSLLFNTVSEEVSTITRDIAQDATMHHRFVSRSGNLDRSIQNNVVMAGNSVIGEIKLNDAIADYGKYVHNGHHSWPPDKFIDQAVERAKPTIVDKLMSTISKVLGL